MSTRLKKKKKKKERRTDFFTFSKMTKHVINMEGGGSRGKW